MLLGLLLILLFEALLRLLSLPKSFALSLLLLNLPNEGLFEPEFERVRARCFGRHCSCRCGLRFVLADQAFPRAGDSLGSVVQIPSIVFSAAKELPWWGRHVHLKKRVLQACCVEIVKLVCANIMEGWNRRKKGGARVRTLACCWPFVRVKLQHVADKLNALWAGIRYQGIQRCRYELRETKVHLCGELYALRPRLVAGGPEHGAYFVDLISFAAAREQWSKGKQLRHDAANSKNIDGGVVRCASKQYLWRTVPSRRDVVRVGRS